VEEKTAEPLSALFLALTLPTPNNIFYGAKKIKVTKNTMYISKNHANQKIKKIIVQFKKSA